MISVRYFPISSHPYSSQLIAGLFDLEAEGAIELTIKTPSKPTVSERDWGSKHNNHLAYLKVSDDNKLWKSVVFDFLDGPEMISPDALSDCDLYFKRSYSVEYISGKFDHWQIDKPELKQKIYPYGLNYPCFSPHEHSRLKRSLIQANTSDLWSKEPRTALKLLHIATTKRLSYWPKKIIGRGSIPTNVACSASTPVKNQILF